MQESILECLAFLSPSLFLVLGSRQKRKPGLKSQLKLPVCGGTSDSRIEPFLGTLVYFCSRADCPMPRRLTTNRTSGKACWSPPGFQIPLHISSGFPSPASKGNTWSPFCFAVTAGPLRLSRGNSFGVAGSLACLYSSGLGHTQLLLPRN